MSLTRASVQLHDNLSEQLTRTRTSHCFLISSPVFHSDILVHWKCVQGIWSNKIWPKEHWSKEIWPKEIWPKGNLSQQKFVPKEICPKKRKLDPTEICPKGNLSQQKFVPRKICPTETWPKKIWPNGRWTQRKIVPTEICPKGNLSQKKENWPKRNFSQRTRVGEDRLGY